MSSGPKSSDGVASWYGADEIPPGALTASGEPFDRSSMTAAALQWDMGSKLRVTNKANNRSVDVRVNDRGPHVPGRCLDLSRGAFQQIGDLDSGLLDVHVEKMN